MREWLMGVDEAGRGPLAGPVAVGVVMAPHSFDLRQNFPGLADSKVLTEGKREELYERLEFFKEYGAVRYAVVFASATTIDRRGISAAVRSAVHKGVESLALPHECEVLLDGLLHAPSAYTQRTIVGGDATEPIISLASVAAKVRRDRLMRKEALVYPGYGFEQHKGYGTKAHQRAIERFGLCTIHRKSYCKNFL